MPDPPEERRRGLRGLLDASQYRLLERAVLSHAPHLIPLLTADADTLTDADLVGLRRAVDDEYMASGAAEQPGTRREQEFHGLVDALAPQRWE